MFVVVDDAIYEMYYCNSKVVIEWNESRNSLLMKEEKKKKTCGRKQTKFFFCVTFHLLLCDLLRLSYTRRYTIETYWEGCSNK